MPKRTQPAYVRVAEHLKRAILEGDMPDGVKLPSLAELAAEHSITRGVAERVVAQLRGEGLLVGRKGEGYFVRRFERITRMCPGRPTDRATTNPEIGETAAPDFVARHFTIGEGDLVVYRRQVFTANDRPVQLTTSYFPIDIARGTALMHTDTGPGGVYTRLDELGWAPTRFRELVVPRGASPEEAAKLRLMRRAAIVAEITRLAWSGERCVEVNRMVLDAAAYELSYDFPA